MTKRNRKWYIEKIIIIEKLIKLLNNKKYRMKITFYISIRLSFSEW